MTTPTTLSAETIELAHKTARTLAPFMRGQEITEANIRAAMTTLTTMTEKAYQALARSNQEDALMENILSTIWDRVNA